MAVTPENPTPVSTPVHTLVLSDIHLTDIEPPHRRNPLWKRFKLPSHFIDDDFKVMLEHFQREVVGPIELVLNGDIFDFDSVMAQPENPSYSVDWLEKARGLNAEEPKSRFKMNRILSDHPVWVAALREFVQSGNRIVFVIGNHDMELHWPSVQEDILRHIGVENEHKDRVKFCEWFYLSQNDTLIEHGNQYDEYCVNINPIHPLIKKGKHIAVRIPFGNLAGKYILNGMGLMNPHADSSFIRSSFAEYMVFYYRYVIRTQPFILWTWFWSAMVTLGISLADGYLPAMRDPLMIDQRVEDIARKANSTPMQIWGLRELQAHAAIFRPMKILQELWLDRAILLVLIVLGSFQFFSFINVIVSIPLWWFFVPVMVLTPFFIFYARSVSSEQDKAQKAAFLFAPLAARITGVRRVVQGHTHREVHTEIDGVDFLNTGTWSPAYEDVECTKPYGRRCFAWIRPKVEGEKERFAELYEWKNGQALLIRSESTSPQSGT